MSEVKAIRIAEVRPAGEGQRLHVRWIDNNKAAMTVDLHGPVYRLKGLRALREPAVFARVRVGEGGHSAVWPGEIDIGADRLWELALEQNGHSDSLEFMRWRRRHGLS